MSGERLRSVVMAGAAVATAMMVGGLLRRKKRPRKLILHFDVNETIMIGDPAGGDTFDDCLNKTLCKNAFIRKRFPAPSPEEVGEGKALGRWGDWTWHDGSPLDPALRAAAGATAAPPILTAFEWPEGCVPMYTVKAFKKKFDRVVKKTRVVHYLGPSLLYVDITTNSQWSCNSK